jgi:hypothetical protein
MKILGNKSRYGEAKRAEIEAVKQGKWVGFEVLTAVSMKMAVFWVVAPCSLVEVYQRFGGPCCLHHQGDTHRLDGGGSKDLRNVGKLLPDYTVLQPRRQPSSRRMSANILHLSYWNLLQTVAGPQYRSLQVTVMKMFWTAAENSWHPLSPVIFLLHEDVYSFSRSSLLSDRPEVPPTA